jgi:hypothetical protein
MTSAKLLDSQSYRSLLKRTHPALSMEDSRLPLPSFIAPLDIREPLLPGTSREIFHMMRNVAPSLIVPRTLFVGTPFERYDQTHLLDSIEDVEHFSEQAKNAARRSDLPLVVLTNISPKHRSFSRWLDAGYCPLPSFPDTVITFQDSDFEEHLMRLPQGDRSGIRRNIRKFEAAGYHLERMQSSREVASTIYEAYLPFFERARVRWQKHTESYFREIADLSQDVFFTVAKNDCGEIAGFVLNFRDGKGFQAGRIGVRPGFYQQYGIYFRLIYHLLDEATRENANQLSLEPTGYRMKRHLGAQARPLVNLVLGVALKWQFLLKSCAGLGRKLLSHLEDPEKLEREY